MGHSLCIFVQVNEDQVSHFVHGSLCLLAGTRSTFLKFLFEKKKKGQEGEKLEYSSTNFNNIACVL